MLGVGVGFNTEGKGRILINSPTNSQNYIIEDSREGWVDSVKFLLDAYFV